MVLFASLIWVVMAQGPTTPLSGTVVGPDGEPVAGAELVLAGMPVYDPPILARGRSDAEGRFRLDRPAGLAGETRFIAPILWVVKPGFRLAYTKFPGPMPGAGEPVRVVLEPPGKAEVRVEGPERRAGGRRAGARRVVRPRIDERTRRGGRSDRGDADKDGLAVIDAAANDEVAYVDVHSKAFGIQGRPFYPRRRSRSAIWLRPAASLEGRLTADDPAMVKGWRVTAYTRSGDPSSPRPDDDRLRHGDDRRRGPVLVPRDRPRRPPARAQAARGPARPGRSPAVLGRDRRAGEFAGDPAPEDRDGHGRGPRARHGPARRRASRWIRPVAGWEDPARPRPTPRGDTRSRACPAQVRMLVMRMPPTHVRSADQRTGRSSRSPRGGPDRAGPDREAIPRAPRRSGSWCATRRANPSPMRRSPAQSSSRGCMLVDRRPRRVRPRRDRAGGRGRRSRPIDTNG